MYTTPVNEISIWKVILDKYKFLFTFVFFNDEWMMN